MFGFLIQTIFIVAFPAVLVGGAAVMYWQQLGRPWLFVVLCLVVLYATYIAIFYLLPSQVVGYTLMETGQAIDGAKRYSVANHKGEVDPSFIGPYLWHLAIFTVLAIPALWFAVRFFGVRAS
jgi:hypothetical protein